MRTSNFVLVAACLGLLTGIAGSDARAQQGSATPALRVGQYNEASEVVVKGTIQAIQAQTGGTLPGGTYVTLQTVPITYTVHMGLFSPASIPFKAGDSVSITGSLVTINGTQIFLARLMQSGSQSLTVRSSNGFVLRGHGAGQKGGLQ